MKRFATILTVVLLLCCALPALGETVAPTDTAAPTDTDAPSATQTPSYTPEEYLQQWYQIGDILRENGNYPFTELRKGDKGFEVQALQTRLAELGFYKKEVVDNFGKGTYNAMRLFEKANDLKVDGIASVKDQQTLFGSTAVAYPDAKLTSNSSNKSSASDTTAGATAN